MMQTSPLISVENLKQLGNCILIHAGNNAKALFDQMHLHGAIYVDLEEDLSSKPQNPAIGGRHPLPSIDEFASLLGRIGISSESHIVIYDDKQGANAAARFWWMLKAIGHEKVQVLNGGLQIAIAVGFPTDNIIYKHPSTQIYPYNEWLLPTASLHQVKEASLNNSKLIIDVRDARRYEGLDEPLDLIAGHIPNAVNIPLTTNLDENGEFISPDLLREKYKFAFANKPSEEVIIHCGSGVTACHTLLAIATAGLELPGLYVGSWSEWSRNELPMALAEA